MIRAVLFYPCSWWTIPSFFKEELELLYSTCLIRRGNFFPITGSFVTINFYEGERHSVVREYEKRFWLLPYTFYCPGNYALPYSTT